MKHIGRIIVVEPNKENEYKSICICPHCGERVEYGEMMMISGTHCCPKCHDELYGTIEYLRKNHYEAYTRIGNNHEDEPYKYNPNDEILSIMKVYNQDTNPNLRTQFGECVKEVFGDVDRFLDLIDRGGTYEKFDVVTGRDRPDDEYYVIDRKTGEYINWYKYTHIGRSIHMNFNPEKMKDFLTRFKESEVEVVNHKEREE